MFEQANGTTVLSAEVSGSKAVALVNTSTQSVSTASGFTFAMPDRTSDPLRSLSLALPGFKFRTVEFDIALAAGAPPLTFSALDAAGHLLAGFSFGSGDLAGNTILSFMLRSSTADISRLILTSLSGSSGGIAEFGHVRFGGVTALDPGEIPPPPVPLPSSITLLLGALGMLSLASLHKAKGRRAQR